MNICVDFFRQIEIKEVQSIHYELPYPSVINISPKKFGQKVC